MLEFALINKQCIKNFKNIFFEKTRIFFLIFLIFEFRKKTEKNLIIFSDFLIFEKKLLLLFYF